MLIRKIVGKEVVGETDTSANTDTPLPDLFTGTMSYRIPIEVPFGRRGVDPGIVLTYRSNNGNGWLGVGWELEMGAIERSTKGGVDYNGNEFVLRSPSGVMELVEVSTQGASPKEYRAKNEGSFIKYLNYGSYWEAIDKKGVLFRFGHETNTTVFDPVNSANIFKWGLDRITDKNGNYVTLNYTKDLNQLYLHEINYTGNDSATPNLPTTNSVKFILEDRYLIDAPVMYTTNFAVITAKRLKTIEVWSNSNSSLVRKYVLNYDADSTPTGNKYSSLTSRSLLGAVTEYGSDGTTAKPPIILGYSVSGGSYSGGWQNQGLLGVTMPLPVGMSCIPGKYGWRYDILCSTGSTGWDLKYLFFNLDKIGVPLKWPNGLPTELTQDSLGHQCVTGDFKGEGGSALACNFANNGDWTMLFPSGSSGEVWSKETWQNAPAVLPITKCFGGDFDGNGKSDFACYANNTWKMALSTGSSWGNSPVQWTGGPSFTTPTNNCMTGDFNGDGKTDFACNAGNSSTWNIYRSNGSGWTSVDWISSGVTVPPLTSSALNVNCMTGDYNGDGKTDIACYIGSTWHVLLSTGNSWDTASFVTGGPTASIPLSAKCLTGEFNGDGRTDISCYTSGGTWSTALSLGKGWNTVSLSGGPSPATSVSQQCFTGDSNADGNTDITCYTGAGPPYSNWESGISSTPATDLLTHVSNGLGGETNVSYTSSSWNSNLPFIMQLVSSVSVNDGNGNTSTSYYSFSGGYYNIATKDFRGFNYAKVLGPVGPDNKRNVTETWFHQGDDTAVDVNNPSATAGFMKGKPYRTRVSDNSYPPQIYSETETTYTTYTAAPYNFSPATQADHFICDGNATGSCKGSSNARHTRTAYYYDDYLTTPHPDYGNVTREERYGDVSNDANKLLNMTIIRNFLPNNANWIVGLPASESVFQGIGSSDSDKVRHSDYYYDDSADCSTVPTSVHTPPTKGNLTHVSHWLDGGTNPETLRAYDDYGNAVCNRDPNSVRDPDGKISTIAYDSTRTFPVSVTNPLQQTTTTKYYGVDDELVDKGLYGQVKSVTDPNGAKISYEYDKFGRKALETLPDDVWTSWDYTGFPQYILTSNSAGIWAYSHLDGFGRTWREERKGPDNKTIVKDTLFDARGAIRQKSLPYFKNLDPPDPPRYVTFGYDPLGRTTSVLNPGSTTAIRSCYSAGVQVDIDENDHRKRQTKDAFGRLVKVEEYLDTFSGDCTTEPGDPYATTTYTYDVLGNLRFVTDELGNQAEMRYDSLGRKYYMKDPDMGVWGYEYDANGNLTLQTDAKLQKIRFNYNDPLNRLKYKDFGDDGVVDVSYTYDEPTSTYPLGRLTTMTYGSGNTKYHYDIAGRVHKTVRTIDGTGYTTTFEHELGRLKSITYPDDETLTYHYDPAGNLDQAIGYATFAGFNALGQPGTVTYGNGVVTSYGYFPSNNRLLSIDTTSPTQGGLISLGYDYYNNGNVKTVTDNLNAAVPLNFVSESFTPHVSKPHAVGTVGSGLSFNYDDNGNMTTDGKRSIAYNMENMPTSINDNVFFTYDGNGQRVKKSSSSGSRVYIDNLYECTDGFCGKYIFAGDTRIALKKGAELSYYHQDHLGSTIAVTDGNGAVTGTPGNKSESIVYYPFGETRADSGVENLNHKYTSQENDYEIGLYNYNARLYSPEMGRFISADPIISDPTNPQNLNRYSYVLNNPTNLVDPTGNEATTDYYNNGNSSQGDQGSSSAGGGGSGSFREDWKPWAQRFERIGREIGRWGRDIGDFFGGLFGHKHKSSPPPLEQSDYYSSNSATSYSPGFSGGSVGGGTTGGATAATGSANGVEQFNLVRSPDYFNVTLNAGSLIGWSGSATVDRYGNIYLAHLGASGGKAATIISLSGVAGWFSQTNTPSEKQSSSYLNGSSLSVSGGFVLGGGGSGWSNGENSSYEFGLFTPQAGLSYHYFKQIQRTLPVKW